MAKIRRTREEKVRAHSSVARYTLPAKVAALRSPTRKLSPSGRYGLFAYDPRLIRTDLTKTLILSILAVATIVAMYYSKLI